MSSMDAITNARARAANKAWLEDPANADVVRWLTQANPLLVQNLANTSAEHGPLYRQAFNAVGGDPTRTIEGINKVFVPQSGSFGSMLGSMVSSFAPIIKAAGLVGGIAGGANLLAGQGLFGGAADTAAGQLGSYASSVGGGVNPAIYNTVPTTAAGAGAGAGGLGGIMGSGGVSAAEAAMGGAGAAGVVGGGAGAGTSAGGLGGILSTVGQNLMTGGGMQAIGGLLGSVAGILGPSPGQQATGAQNMVDPFAPYRTMYAQQLNQLMQNPASVQQLPGYQAQMQQGTQAVQRALAAKGGAASGQELMGLQDYASAQQNQYFQQQLQNLAMLSGANISPTQGGVAGVRAGQAGAQQQMKNIGGIASGIGSLITPTK